MSLYVETLEAENESLRAQLQKMREEARKKVDIDTACNWLLMKGVFPGNITLVKTLREFVEDFRKAMTES